MALEPTGSVWRRGLLDALLVSGEAFTEEDEGAVLALATAAATTIHNARHYHQPRRERWLEALGELSFLGGGHPRAALAGVARGARELVSADVALVALPDEAGRFVVEAADGKHAEELEGVAFASETPTSAAVVSHGLSELFRPPPGGELGAAPVSELTELGPSMLVPLTAGRRAAGILAVANDVAIVALPDEAGRFVVEAADGKHAEELEGVTFASETPTSAAVVSHGLPELFRPPLGGEPGAAPVPELTELGPSMLVPLTAGRRAAGILAVANVATGPSFGPDDPALLESFARQASVVLEYARARGELEQERVERELHDDKIIRQLFFTAIALQEVMRRVHDPVVAERIEQAVSELDRTIADIRSSIFALRSRTLGHSCPEPEATLGSRKRTR